MNQIQRENWNIIRKSKRNFFIKYIAIFYIPAFFVTALVFVIKGFEGILNDLTKAKLMDLFTIIFLVFGWAYFGYIRGKLTWDTWEKEYSGENVFAVKYSERAVKDTGMTNHPHKEFFAIISALFFTLAPPLIIMSVSLSTFVIWLEKIAPQRISENNTIVIIVSGLIFGSILLAVFLLGLLLGGILWVFFLRPFYSYGETINLINFSDENNFSFFKSYTNLLNKIANVIYRQKINSTK